MQLGNITLQSWLSFFVTQCIFFTYSKNRTDSKKKHTHMHTHKQRDRQTDIETHLSLEPAAICSPSSVWRQLP